MALEAATQRYRVRHDYTLQSLPSNLTRPMRIVVGDLDRITRPEAIAAHAPDDIPVHVVHGASHALPWEAPDSILEETLALLPSTNVRTE